VDSDCHLGRRNPYRLSTKKLFAEMAAMFPNKSSGVSRYAIEGWKHKN
jgi:hypothetical protein